MRYLIPLVLSLASCFGLQTLALRAVGGRTTKSESNFFSSIARIQTGIRDHPRIMLLGSSMTGRFPDRSSGFTGVANLGCDGGNALDTLRAMDAGILPVAPVMVIEGNMLYRSIGRADTETSIAIRAPWFRVGRRFPALGATARPSAFAYSRLLAGKIGRAEGPKGLELPVLATASVVREGSSLPPGAQSVVEEAKSILERMDKKGIQLLIVILPPSAAEDSLDVRIPRELSKQSGIPLLDLTAGLPADSVRLTDGLHMAPESAAAALRSILAALQDR